MYVVVGRFQFRPMAQDERRAMFQRWEQQFTPLAQSCPGFRGVNFIQLGDDEVVTDWHWDSEDDWNNAQARFAPFLQQHLAPQLAGPPERFAGSVVLAVSPV